MVDAVKSWALPVSNGLVLALSFMSHVENLLKVSLLVGSVVLTVYQIIRVRRRLRAYAPPPDCPYKHNPDECPLQ